MFVGVLLFLFVCVSGIRCDLKSLQHQIQDLRLDAESQSLCQRLISQLQECEGDGRQHLMNQLFYRLGLIQLSQKQEWRAIESFERVDPRDPFGQLSERALEKLYVQFGYWDKVDGELKVEFEKLNSSSSSLSMDTLHEMLRISPYDQRTRSLMREALIHQLRRTLDPSTAQEFISNNEMILEKYATRLNVSQRLALHFEAAVVQMFVANSAPTHLRKCLALDMDYEPCKRMTLLNTRLSKINPYRSQVLDPEVYAFGEESIDWKKVVSFYLLDKKPCAKLPQGYKFENNYKLVEKISEESLFEVLGGSERSDFQRFIDSILCQASCQAPATRKSASPFCKMLLKDVLTPEEHRQVQKSATQGEKLPSILLEELWVASPNLAMYVVEGIMSRGGKRSAALQDQFAEFFQRHKLSQAHNKYVKMQFNGVNSLVHQRQQQQEQQQRQKQEWFFRQQQQQQQQQHQQQRQQQQPAKSVQTEKDYYKILSVPKDATSKEIRKAYLNFTKMHHPDKQGQLSEEEQRKIDEKMSEINEAYETLSDESTRREYDMARSGGGHHGGAPDGGMYRQQGANPFQFNQNFKFNFGF